jgi:hypothetical protein
MLDLQRRAGNRAVQRFVARVETGATRQRLQRQAMTDAGQASTPPPTTRRPSTLVIYTGGDTRPLQATGRRQAQTAPLTYSELYLRRAREIGGSNAVVQTFVTIDEAIRWLERAENRERFNDVRFVGHGDPGRFAFSTPRGGSAGGPLVLDFNAPNSAFVRALANVVPPAVVTGASGPSVIRRVDIDVEACETGAGRLNRFGAAMLAEGLSGTVSGYDVPVRTTWRARTGRTEIGDAFGRSRGLASHRRTIDVRP